MTIDINNRLFSVYAETKKYGGSWFLALTVWWTYEVGLTRDWEDSDFWGEITFTPYYLYFQGPGLPTRAWTLPFQKKNN